MGTIDFILEHLKAHEQQPAIFWRGEAYSRRWVVDQVRQEVESLLGKGFEPGVVVLLRSDYSPRTIAVLLALIELRTILVPILPSTLEKTPTLVQVVDPAFQINIECDGELSIEARAQSAPHPLVNILRQAGKPGLILFTSGSTGQPKGVVHDFSRLLMKFHTGRPSLRTLNFLLFDHWGGLNTLLHCLANGSPVALPEGRTPQDICRLLERHHIELLPATPTFLNMLLLSKAYRGRDLSALRMITYGSEPMPTTTLTGLRGLFPNVELRQTYGLVELGVLRAKSLSSDSLWVKVGGEGYELRVVDGILEIKADSAMLGYLNAPSPFTDDGFFITGDRIEQKGEYIRFLGKDSELINVGGKKVFPAEVEGVLLECDLVEDVVVYGKHHPITGQIVCADVRLSGAYDEGEARCVIKRFCMDKLDRFKIPVIITFVAEGIQGDRFKRLRAVRGVSTRGN